MKKSHLVIIVSWRPGFSMNANNSILIFYPRPIRCWSVLVSQLLVLILSCMLLLVDPIIVVLSSTKWDDYLVNQDLVLVALTLTPVVTYIFAVHYYLNCSHLCHLHLPLFLVQSLIMSWICSRSPQPPPTVHFGGLISVLFFGILTSSVILMVITQRIWHLDNCGPPQLNNCLLLSCSVVNRLWFASSVCSYTTTLFYARCEDIYVVFNLLC